METQTDAIERILGPKKGEKNHLSSRRDPKSIKRHIWTIKDETLAINLYKANASEDEIKLALVDIEISLSSMLMKIDNIKYLDTGNGLKNVSETTKRLWLKLK